MPQQRPFIVIICAVTPHPIQACFVMLRVEKARQRASLYLQNSALAPLWRNSQRQYLRSQVLPSTYDRTHLLFFYLMQNAPLHKPGMVMVMLTCHLTIR